MKGLEFRKGEGESVGSLTLAHDARDTVNGYRRGPQCSPYGKKTIACAQTPGVWLRLARLPPPASRVRRSRGLRDTLAAVPGLLAHASVAETVKSSQKG